MSQKPTPKKPAAKRSPAKAAPKPRFPIVWVIVGAAVAVAAGLVVVSAAGNDGGSTGSTGGVSAVLVARTRAARVPLLTEEGFATHTHSQLNVSVNGSPKEVPALIGIDTESGHIAVLHTHDASGLVHVESPTTKDSYTLGQFLTLWGMPADAAGRCAFFGAASPCTLAVNSQKSGAVGLDVKLVDNDTLELTVTS